MTREDVRNEYRGRQGVHARLAAPCLRWMRVAVLAQVGIAATAILGSAATLGACSSHNGKESGSYLAAGTQAPSLVATDHRGVDATLAALRGKHVLVYFYPRDNTPGCTKEACAIRDIWAQYEAKNVVVLGVSNDSTESHVAFAKEHNLPFGLIADTDEQWAKAFGVASRGGYYPRVSFLIDPEGKIKKVFPNVDPGVHASEVLALVNA